MASSLFRYEREEPRTDSEESLLAEYPRHKCHQSKSYKRFRLLSIVFITMSTVLSVLCISLAVALANSGNERSVGYWNPTDLSESLDIAENFTRL